MEITLNYFKQHKMLSLEAAFDRQRLFVFYKE